jgi:nitrate reductase NapE component
MAPANKLLAENSMIRNTLAEIYKTLWAGFAAHAYVWSVLLIVLSLGVIILFCIRYMSITSASSGRYRFFFIAASGYAQLLQSALSAQLTKTATSENKNTRADMSVRKAVFKMSHARRGQPPSFFQSARLIRFAMFSASATRGNLITSLSRNAMRMVAAFNGAFGIIVWSMINTRQNYHTCFSMLVFFSIMAFTIEATFQSNKNQLSALYLQTDMPSKSAFMKAVAAGYLLLNAEVFLIFTAAAMAAYVFITNHVWPFMFQMIFINAAMVLINTSILFTTNNQRNTPNDAAFWRPMRIVLLIIPFTMISYTVNAISTTAGWITTGICVIVSALIFYAALRHWTKSEMDCA